MTQTSLKVRRSLIDIQNDFTSGKDKDPLEKLMVAWQFIKSLPASDPNSFFALGGYHGEPFAGRGSYDVANYWGGYCNHGNILFPTWHRVYLHKLEKALQSVPGCDSVMLPYWDQTYKITGKDGNLTYLGIPSCLTDEYFTFKDGITIPNPLKSFTLPLALQDSGEVNLYTKPQGYETVRYPLSGLVGTPEAAAASKVNNSAYYIAGTNIIDNALTTSLLNGNVLGWLSGSEMQPGATPSDPQAPIGEPDGVDAGYHLSLDAPCYTVFSNSTSVTQWNKDVANWNKEHPKQLKPLTQALENPHGEIHLAVGGINAPTQDADPNSPNPFLPAADANGDMGENETAGLDPIFFFHHCNVDRIFWMWQVKHKSTNNIDISVPQLSATTIAAGPYPGTNNINNQPPTGYEPTEQLTMESPLYPFKLVENGVERNYQSKDVFNIEKQLGFTYDNLSLDNTDGMAKTLKAIAVAKAKPAPVHKSNKVLIVDGINRAKINGSFVVLAYATINGNRYYLGSHAVLSRWRVVACKNCMINLEVTAIFSLYRFSESELQHAIYDVQIQGRSGNATEFAKFTVANQANFTKSVSASASGTIAANSTLMKTAIASHDTGIHHKNPFKLQVV